MMDQSQRTEEEREVAPHCYWHPDVETGLSCSRCGKHICTRCAVQAPVGIRCRECGQAARMPTYDVQPTYYARAIAAAAVVAVGGGILWWVFNLLLIFIFQGALPGVLASVGAVGVGYVGGDLISRAVNRKRSTGLAWVSALSVLIAYGISLQLTGPFFSLFGLVLIAVGVFMAVQRVRR